MSAAHYIHTGRFNMLSSDKQDQVVLSIDGKQVSAIWPEGESEYDSGMLPSEVLCLIQSRIESYLFLSDRKQKADQIDAMKAVASKADMDWCNAQASRLEAKAKALRIRADELESELLQATGEQP